MSIHVGDTVRIKSWDEMVEEYGMYNENVIECPNCVFTKSMEFLCNQLLTVKDIANFGFHLSKPTYEITFCENIADGFTITNHMVKRVGSNTAAQIQEQIMSLFED